MQNKQDFDTQGIMWGDLRRVTPLVVIIVTIALSWGSLSAQIGLLNQKTDTVIDGARQESARVDLLDGKEQALSTRLTTIEAVIGSRGTQNSAGVSAKPASNSATLVFAKEIPTYQYLAPTRQPAPTDAPTPAPQPTPTPILPVTTTILKTIGLL